MKKTDDVTAYLAKLPPEERKVLAALLSSVNGGEVVVSYGVPTIRFEGRAVIAASANGKGLSLHVMSMKVVAALKASLEKYGVSGGTLKFTASTPLPKTVVKKIVTARVAENRALDAARKKKR
ncbi:MAG: iron chaperone [Archangium sp.]